MNALGSGLSRGEQLLVSGAALICLFSDVSVGLVTGFGIDSDLVGSIFNAF